MVRFELTYYCTDIVRYILNGFCFAGIFTFRKSVSNSPLPSTRTIGNAINQINPYNPAPSPVLNYGALLIGQYITHDVGLRGSFQNSMYSKFER